MRHWRVRPPADWSPGLSWDDYFAAQRAAEERQIVDERRARATYRHNATIVWAIGAGTALTGAGVEFISNAEQTSDGLKPLLHGAGLALAGAGVALQVGAIVALEMQQHLQQ